MHTNKNSDVILRSVQDATNDIIKNNKSIKRNAKLIIVMSMIACKSHIEKSIIEAHEKYRLQEIENKTIEPTEKLVFNPTTPEFIMLFIDSFKDMVSESDLYFTKE